MNKRINETLYFQSKKLRLAVLRLSFVFLRDNGIKKYIDNIYFKKTIYYILFPAFIGIYLAFLIERFNNVFGN